MKKLLPLIVAINDDIQELIIKKIDISISSGCTLKLKKSGNGTAQVVIKNGSTTILGANSSESMDILPQAIASDLILSVDGSAVGECTLELIFSINNTTVTSDQIKVKVVKGDVIFRKGDPTLAELMGETFTHSGIDWEKNVTDVNPEVQHDSLAGFESYAVAGSPRKRVRINKNCFMSRRIWAKIFDNMDSESYALPTGTKQWNLFSTYENYITSNCNEFTHEQFRKAVNDVFSELSDSQQRTQFMNAYFAGGSIKKLVFGQHKTELTLQSPATTLAVMAGEAYLNLKFGTANAEHRLEGEIVMFLQGPNMRYKYGATSCSVCGDYPSPPWYMWFVLSQNTMSVTFEEVHITTTTPESFLNSSFFEEITY